MGTEELLDEMTLLQLEADAISRNAAISACARSGDWDMALSLLCGMQAGVMGRKDRGDGIGRSRRLEDRMTCSA